jgi:hypothetical protein
MPDIKFSCPSCQQHIQADEGYAGMQVNCPTCQTSLLVPGAVPAPAPRLLTLQAPAPPPSAPGPEASPASGCPSCGNALPHGAVLCVNCGFNLTTGKKMGMTTGHMAAPGRPVRDQWETPWYKSPYIYLWSFLAILGVIYLLGRQNPAFMLGFLGLAALFSFGVHIAVLVTAFREGAGTGFLALCIPFYAIYFVFKVNESDVLKMYYTVAIILNLSLKFLIPDVE